MQSKGRQCFIHELPGLGDKMKKERHIIVLYYVFAPPFDSLMSISEKLIEFHKMNPIIDNRVAYMAKAGTNPHFFQSVDGYGKLFPFARI